VIEKNSIVIKFNPNSKSPKIIQAFEFAHLLKGCIDTQGFMTVQSCNFSEEMFRIIELVYELKGTKLFVNNKNINTNFELIMQLRKIVTCKRNNICDGICDNNYNIIRLFQIIGLMDFKNEERMHWRYILDQYCKNSPELVIKNSEGYIINVDYLHDEYLNGIPIQMAYCNKFRSEAILEKIKTLPNKIVVTNKSVNYFIEEFFESPIEENFLKKIRKKIKNLSSLL